MKGSCLVAGEDLMGVIQDIIINEAAFVHAGRRLFSTAVWQGIGFCSKKLH